MDKISVRSSCLLLAFLVICTAGLLVWNTSLLRSWKDVLVVSAYGDEGMPTVDSLMQRLVQGRDRATLETTGFSCRADRHTEICLSSKPVRVANYGLKVYVMSNRIRFTRIIQPYARKEDFMAMRAVTPVQIIYGETNHPPPPPPPPPPPCNVSHNVTAVVFSSGGFSGNTFHEINEIVIPLFLTSCHFGKEVQFVVTDDRRWLVQKYRKVLAGLSGYNVLNLSDDERVHCFPGAILGLKYHGNLALNPKEIPGGYDMLEFKRFMRVAYDLNVASVKEIRKPKLMLIARRETRKILNEESLVELMTGVGFEVVVADDSMMLSLERFVETVNSCSVMVGVHGAGLTNGLFLPDGAVMVQIVPFGMEWAAKTYYGKPETTMGLRHIEYRIKHKESSLSKKYGPDHPVIRDPDSVFAKGYVAARTVYFDKQDVEIDLVRFRKTLVKALKLVGN